MQAKKHICRIPLQISKSPSEVFRHAAEMGREAGMGADWVPPTFKDALFEIIVTSSNPAEQGVVILPSSELGREDVIELRVHYIPGWNLGAICEDIRKLMDAPDADTDECIVLILTAIDPPIELGIEIHAIEAPSSKHAIMEEFRAAESARTDI